jgi:hypothetical protein
VAFFVRMPRLGALLLVTSVLACGADMRGPWTGTAATALATSFGSPVGFTCVVGWDLDYTGADLADVAIDVRFPSAVQDQLVDTTPAGLPMTSPWPRYDEWQAWRPLEMTGQGTLAAMIARRHVVGAMGVPCRSKSTPIAMIGTELRIRWTHSSLRTEQVIVVRETRPWVRVMRNLYGDPVLEWRATE